MVDLYKIATEIAAEEEDLPEVAAEELRAREEERDVAELVSQIVQDATTVVRIQERFVEGVKFRAFKAHKTAWIHNLLHLNGQKFDFTGRDYLLPIYNAPFREVLLKTARQVEKSTLLANNMAIMCAINAFFKCLYVSPSHMQTRQFSNEKLKPVLEQSPLLARYLIDNQVSQQVFEKGFTNGAMMFLRSAFLTADRARGISSDMCCIDELQSMLITNIPVILECLSHSKHKYQFFTGTPLTHDNTIEIYWQQSSQCEWMVPCTCQAGEAGRYWNFLDERNIGKKGVICKKCGKPLTVPTGKWVQTKDARLKGFRIPQLMVPWIINTQNDWEVLLHKFETYPTAQFQNEVLGLSFDSASKPITQMELMQCCKDYEFWGWPMTPEEEHNARRHILVGGVDWGEGHDGGTGPTGKLRSASYTVFTIGSVEGGKKFKIHFMKKYTGKEIDPGFIVNDIANICQRLNVRVLGVDWGHGWGPNNDLVRRLGFQRVIQFMHMPKLKERRKWEPVGKKFLLNRNLIMSELFYKFKKGEMTLPRWQDFAPYAKDILGIFAEYVEYQRQIRFDHRPSDPDDSFHSILYAWQAGNIFHGHKD